MIQQETLRLATSAKNIGLRERLEISPWFVKKLLQIASRAATNLSSPAETASSSAARVQIPISGQACRLLLLQRSSTSRAYRLTSHAAVGAAKSSASRLMRNVSQREEHRSADSADGTRTAARELSHKNLHHRAIETVARGLRSRRACAHAKPWGTRGAGHDLQKT